MRLTFATAGIGTLPDDYFRRTCTAPPSCIIRFIAADGLAPPEDINLSVPLACNTS